MPRYLLTHSLLSSWLYTMKSNPRETADSDKDAMADFLRVLHREPTKTTDAMQNGIDFENLVTAICRGDEMFGYYEMYDIDLDIMGAVVPAETREHPWYKAAKQIADLVRGGQMQYKAKKEIQVDGYSILLYGRLDWLKAGTIYDIKFSKGYERGKYVDSTQHPVYMELIPEASEFTYLVSNGASVWTETYRRDETPSIYPTISYFLAWLEGNGLLADYLTHWAAK
ncbi:MAG: hypothetical protein LUH03_09740 [Oscillospiraceae bacterium]|nr:hypothetical protein [Oscillospiraceae bacterium]